jgi:hypothetical protein
VLPSGQEPSYSTRRVTVRVCEAGAVTSDSKPTLLATSYSYVGV